MLDLTKRALNRERNPFVQLESILQEIEIHKMKKIERVHTKYKHHDESHKHREIYSLMLPKKIVELQKLTLRPQKCKSLQPLSSFEEVLFIMWNTPRV